MKMKQLKILSIIFNNIDFDKIWLDKKDWCFDANKLEE